MPQEHILVRTSAKKQYFLFPFIDVPLLNLNPAASHVFSAFFSLPELAQFWG